MVDINKVKFEFLSDELWVLSWGASVQRALKYNKGVATKDRAKFKQNIINYCSEHILPMYKQEVTEVQHKNNIEKICHYANELDNSSILAQNYNIGIAQKLLNMQLKYLWVSDNIKRPPHCPVDRIILGKTNLKNKLNWTQIETLETYQKAIDAISAVAKNQHIAEWELHIFNRRQ